MFFSHPTFLLKIKVDKIMGKGKIIDEIFGIKCEPNLIQPTFIIDYPIEMSPLAKKHRSEQGLVERFELFIGGMEIANSFSELNDPSEQLSRLTFQSKLKELGDEEAQNIDMDFIHALEVGMPPAVGIGIGIDRIIMILTEQKSIKDVILFPTLRTIK